MTFGTLISVTCVLVALTFLPGGSTDHAGFKVMELNELRQLVEEANKPYLKMKNEREGLANNSTTELFELVQYIQDPLARAKTAVIDLATSVNKRTSLVRAVFWDVGEKLQHGLGELEYTQSKCPNHMGLDDEEVTEDLVKKFASVVIPEVAEWEDLKPDTYYNEVFAQDLWTKGAEGRLAELSKKFGNNYFIRLTDAMKVYSASAQMCERYAAMRLAGYLNAANRVSAIMRTNIDRLDEIVDRIAQVKEALDMIKPDQTMELFQLGYQAANKLKKVYCPW